MVKRKGKEKKSKKLSLAEFLGGTVPVVKSHTWDDSTASDGVIEAKFDLNDIPTEPRAEANDVDKSFRAKAPVYRNPFDVPEPEIRSVFADSKVRRLICGRESCINRDEAAAIPLENKDSSKSAIEKPTNSIGDQRVIVSHTNNNNKMPNCSTAFDKSCNWRSVMQKKYTSETNNDQSNPNPIFGIAKPVDTASKLNRIAPSPSEFESDDAKPIYASREFRNGQTSIDRRDRRDGRAAMRNDRSPDEKSLRRSSSINSDHSNHGNRFKNRCSRSKSKHHHPSHRPRSRRKSRCCCDHSHRSSSSEAGDEYCEHSCGHHRCKTDSFKCIVPRNHSGTSSFVPTRYMPEFVAMASPPIYMANDLNARFMRLSLQNEHLYPPAQVITRFNQFNSSFDRLDDYNPRRVRKIEEYHVLEKGCDHYRNSINPIAYGLTRSISYSCNNNHNKDNVRNRLAICDCDDDNEFHDARQSPETRFRCDFPRGRYDIRKDDESRRNSIFRKTRYPTSDRFEEEEEFMYKDARGSSQSRISRHNFEQSDHYRNYLPIDRSRASRSTIYRRNSPFSNARSPRDYRFDDDDEESFKKKMRDLSYDRKQLGRYRNDRSISRTRISRSSKSPFSEYPYCSAEHKFDEELAYDREKMSPFRNHRSKSLTKSKQSSQIGQPNSPFPRGEEATTNYWRSQSKRFADNREQSRFSRSSRSSYRRDCDRSPIHRQNSLFLDNRYPRRLYDRFDEEPTNNARRGTSYFPCNRFRDDLSKGRTKSNRSSTLRRNSPAPKSLYSTNDRFREDSPNKDQRGSSKSRRFANDHEPSSINYRSGRSRSRPRSSQSSNRNYSNDYRSSDHNYMTKNDHFSSSRHNRNSYDRDDDSTKYADANDTLCPLRSEKDEYTYEPRSNGRYSRR